MKMYLNGKKIAESKALDFGSFNCPGGLTVGNDGKSHPFSGTVYYLVFFKEVMNQEKIQNFHSAVYTTVLLPKGGNNPLGVVTSDGRPCITPPTQDPQPGKPGAPPAPNYNGSASADGSGGDTDKDANYASKDDSKSSNDEEGNKELDNLNKDNPDLAKKVLNENGLDAGSDKATCMMLASNF